MTSQIKKGMVITIKNQREKAVIAVLALCVIVACVGLFYNAVKFKMPSAKEAYNILLIQNQKTLRF